MAFQTIWYHTELPKNIIETIEKDLGVFDEHFQDASVGNNSNPVVNKFIRNSKNLWIPTSSWIGGFCWHYVMRANKENFLYDLTSIDGESLQYTQYTEGQYYNWHVDAGIDSCYSPKNVFTGGLNNLEDKVSSENEYIRKLSFTIQLSDPADYRGGEVQFMDLNGKSYFMPKDRGTMVLFDSRTPHRVRKVKSGVRKSLVGWVIGPRWK